MLTAAMVALVGGELWLGQPSVPAQVPAPGDVYDLRPPSTQFLVAHAGPGRVLSVAQEAYEPADGAAIRARLAALPERAVFNYLAAQKWNAILMGNVASRYGLDSVDGYDGGVLPLRTFVTLSGALVQGGEPRPDGVLISRLTSVPRTALLDLLNVGYVVDGGVRDATVEGVPLDRSIVTPLLPQHDLALRALPDLTASQVALLSALEGERTPALGEQVGRIELEDVSGRVTTLPIRAGWETAPAEPGRASTAPGSTLRVVHPSGWTAPGQPEDYLARVDLPRTSWRGLRVVNDSTDLTLVVTAMTLLDEQTSATASLVLRDGLRRLTFPDLKVYAYDSVLPRAYLVGRARVLDDDAALDAISRNDFDPRREVLLAPGPDAAPLKLPDGQPAEVSRDELAPEHVEVAVRSERGGWLVLSDAYTPDWHVTIDGVAAPLVRANVALRAVRVSPGAHTVDLVYAPRSLALGAAFSAASLAVAACLVIAARLGSGGAWRASRALGRRTQRRP
jgi:hypothetical protein